MYRLREIRKCDIATINRWRNDKELIDSLGAPFRYINEAVDEKWFDNYMMHRENTVRCAIVYEDKDVILGMISLVSVDYINQSAALHIMIGDKENQGKGMGMFAVNEMLRHAFYNMNLRRIELTVLEENERATKLYEKAGFVREGLKRCARYKNGKFVNVLVYSILREEYELCQKRF